MVAIVAKIQALLIISEGLPSGTAQSVGRVPVSRFPDAALIAGHVHDIGVSRIRGCYLDAPGSERRIHRAVSQHLAWPEADRRRADRRPMGVGQSNGRNHAVFQDFQPWTIPTTSCPRCRIATASLVRRHGAFLSFMKWDR